jgi:CBS domain containing-hemolysin-like protein
MNWLEALLVVLLFLVGLRLSFFFSGSETGFYRISLPRVSIDAQAGDLVARRLMWFARHPSYFVATTLVGNNLANYLVTLAITLFVPAIVGHPSQPLEIGVTVLFAPIVFLFGELLPKKLYFRAPLALLRRDSTLFAVFFWLLLPATWPLVKVTALVERLFPERAKRMESLLGRSRLVQLMTQGRREGLLTDVQNRLAHGVLQIAPQPVVDSMTPAGRVLGVSDQSSRQEILDYARRFATPVVAIRRPHSEEDWYAYVRVVDIALDKRPVTSLLRPMPVISPRVSKLDALQGLMISEEIFGVVKEGERVQGVVSSRGLCEQLFRPAIPFGHHAV